MKTVFVVLCVLVMLLGAACGDRQQGSATSAPLGVHTQGGHTYYTVSMPEGKTVDDYFVLMGRAGTLVVSRTDMSTFSDEMGTVYYNQVSCGGWVAYWKNKQESFLYMPADYPEDMVKHTASVLAFGSEGMPVEAAREYIPGMK